MVRNLYVEVAFQERKYVSERFTPNQQAVFRGGRLDDPPPELFLAIRWLLLRVDVWSYSVTTIRPCISEKCPDTVQI